MFGKKIVNTIFFLALCIFLFGSGYKLGLYTNKLPAKNQYFNSLNAPARSKNIDFSLFWEAWNKVSDKFIGREKIDTSKMYYGAIKGMIASLDDPYTFFLTPAENKQSKDDLGGKFEGIGAQLGLKDNKIVVIAPLKSSPAENAGVRAGDFINKVDDASIKGWTLPAAVAKIRGPKGTKVKLTLERKEKEFDLTITRDQITINSVELSFENSTNCQNNCAKVAYLKLNQFSDTTNDEWDAAAGKISESWKKREVRGLVLDLRDNPGGYLDSAVYLSSEFLPQGKTVVKQESTTTDTKNYYIRRDGKLLDIPVVVLINKGSASASEILAGALRDFKRAKLVGEKSFGKGSVQEALDLKDGAGLHVTVAKWILPNGDWINGKGIEPDVKIEQTIQEGTTMTKDKDVQLEKAIQEIVK